MRSTALIAWFFCIISVANGGIDEEEERLPTKCHVCKHLVREMLDELGRSGKSNEVFTTGQLFQQERKKIDYRTSELRLTEALENACSNVLDYKVHKDKPVALRYEKVESVTFKTLKGLKNKGVKVDLGFPDDMWDTPDAEVTRLKNRCEFMVETYEEELEDWYWNHQATNLTEWLCVNRVLGPDQLDCFHETIPEKQDEDEGREDSDSEKIKRLVRKQADEQAESRENDRKRDGNGASRADKNGRGKTNGKNEKKDITSDENNDKEDPDKIERLIRAQAERQAKRAGNTRKSPGRLGKEKRDELKRRLQNIDDPLRLRREIRKIRLNELDEGDYSPVELREDEGIDSVPEDIREEYRRRQYERMEDLEELQHELRLRAFEHDEFEGPEWVRLREFRRQFVEDTEDIRDPRELRKRIQDLDALSAIFGRPDRHRLGGRDEL